MESKKRIAFCLFGQVRFVDKLKEYYEFLCDNDNYTVDIFIATWNDFDTNLLNLNFKDKLFIEKEVAERVGAKGNTSKMAYSLSNSIQLKRKAEIEENFTYDYVVVKRVDLVLRKSVFYDSLAKINFDNETLPCVYALDEFSLTQEKNSTNSFPAYRISQDYTFIENSLAADLHSLMYSFFWIHKHQQKLNITYREGGHWNHIYFFKFFNFNIRSIFLEFFLVRPVLDHKVFEEYANSEELVHKLAMAKIKYKKDKKKYWQLDNLGKYRFKDKIV